jgi:tRNA methyltransferase complex GCD14 subunit
VADRTMFKLELELDSEFVCLTRYMVTRRTDHFRTVARTRLPSCSRNGKAFYLLRPTPELCTLALPHRKQILYLAMPALVAPRPNEIGQSNNTSTNLIGFVVSFVCLFLIVGFT